MAKKFDCFHHLRKSEHTEESQTAKRPVEKIFLLYNQMTNKSFLKEREMT